MRTGRNSALVKAQKAFEYTSSGYAHWPEHGSDTQAAFPKVYIIGICALAGTRKHDNPPPA